MNESYQTLKVRETESGEWEVTQDGIDIVGTGENPARAVADFGELVAESAYEGGEQRASD